MIDIFEDIETALTIQTQQPTNVSTLATGLGKELIEPLSPNSPEAILKRSNISNN
jgi:hypothetical protein